MRLTRLVLIAAAAAGIQHYLKKKGRGTSGLPWAPRQRLELGGGMGAAAPAAPKVAETVWTPSEPAAAEVAPSTPSTAP